MNLSKGLIKTPLGDMLAVSEGKYLVFLDFVDSKNLDKKFKPYEGLDFSPSSSTMELIKKELHLYFAKKLSNFFVPIKITGSSFQKSVYKELVKVPYGTKNTYSDLAEKINRPKAYRAVANANAINPLAIIVPCHRIVGKDSTLRGYAGGAHRKSALLELEASLWRN